MTSLLAIAAILLVLVVVVGIVYRMLKLAMWAALLAVLSVGAWLMLRPYAPPELRHRVEQQAASLADKSENAARAWSKDAAEVSRDAAAHLERLAKHKAQEVVNGVGDEPHDASVAPQEIGHATPQQGQTKANHAEVSP